MNKIARIIIANGEKYITPVEKKSGGGPRDFPRNYSDARDILKNGILSCINIFTSLPSEKRIPDEATFCLRLHPDMIAKSYDPVDIFERTQGLRNVGSRNYKIPRNNVAQTKRIKKLSEQEQIVTSRLVFAQGKLECFTRLLSILETAESRLSERFKEEVRSIERFDLLSWEEQLSDPIINSDSWSCGRAELVFHPSKKGEGFQTNFLYALFGDSTLEGKVMTAHYENGPFFVSCRIDKESLSQLKNVNPLRSIRSMEMGNLPTLRTYPGLKLPIAPISSMRSSIKVGVFDGGVHTNNPILSSHIEEDIALSVKTPLDPDAMAHGTAVSGVTLFGPLNEKGSNDVLPIPDVSVVSFRVFPTSNPNDVDLFETIDVVENVVPARPDIKVYNLSFGPIGPILDDSVSRFTYALDNLAANHKVTFVVAVGNDGDRPAPLNRIQSPSDLVNGLGVGAYTIRDGKPMHARYSCHGPGRECAKIKPELVAFGGCEVNPIHLIGASKSDRVLSQGTSFSAPFVSRLVAQATGLIERSSVLLGRTLVLHSVSGDVNDSNRNQIGYGYCPKSINEILECDPTRVTIVYQGTIPPKKMRKLPILLPPKLINRGKVKIKWTIGTLPRIDPLHPFDYTTTCIEDTFYPDSRIFRLNPPKSSKQKPMNVQLGVDDVIIKSLEQQGWKLSLLPLSGAGKNYLTEKERRNALKWETVVCREVTKYADKLENPAIVLHAVPRHNVTCSIDFAVAVTIEAQGFEGDLYAEILRKYVNLQPARIKTENEIRVHTR